jgi:hypothetical protein
MSALFFQLLFDFKDLLFLERVSRPLIAVVMTYTFLISFIIIFNRLIDSLMLGFLYRRLKRMPCHIKWQYMKQHYPDYHVWCVYLCSEAYREHIVARLFRPGRNIPYATIAIRRSTNINRDLRRTYAAITAWTPDPYLARKYKYYWVTVKCSIEEDTMWHELLHDVTTLVKE